MTKRIWSPERVEREWREGRPPDCAMEGRSGRREERRERMRVQIAWEWWMKEV